MNTQASPAVFGRSTGNVIPFPARPVRPATPTVRGGAWYHEAAIAEERGPAERPSADIRPLHRLS